MAHLYHDLQNAFRLVRKRPGFAGLIVAALAICIGANTAIFTIVNSVLIRPLPFRDPGRLMSVSETLSALMSGPIPFSVPDYEELVRRNRSFEQIGIYRNRHYELSGNVRPERLEGARISASLFPMLGVSPALGRNFTAEEDRDAHRVVILTADLWRSKFRADPSVIGKTIDLDRVPYVIVGIMPAAFSFPLRGPKFNDEPAQVYVPTSFTKDELQGFGNMYNDSVIARLRPGVTVAQARSDVKSVVRQVYQEVYPAELRRANLDLGADLMPYRNEVVGDAEPILLVLLGAVGLLLLIGCADVASLLLTRATSRQREMSIRVALGAARSHLIRQMLMESLVLAFIGGALGLLLSGWATDLLVNAGVFRLPVAAALHADAPVFAFTFALSAATAVLFGLFPALQTSHVDVNEGLREGGRGQTAGRRQGRTLDLMVTAQFALALILLVGAGLLMRSFSRLLATNPGFRPDHILSMSVSLPASAYQTGAEVRSFYERALQSVESVPGVKAAALATSLPLSIDEHDTFSIEGQLPQTLSIPRSAAQIWSMGNFFEAMGIPLEQGRLFDSRDGRNSPPVAIVGQTLANKFWPGQSPIGKRIKWGESDSKDPWMTIVGVVGDVKQGALNQQTEPETYTPYEQVADKDLGSNITGEMRSLKIVARTAIDPAAEAPAIRRRLRVLDPSLPVSEVSTMETVLHNSVQPQRFNTILLGTFAAIAVILAALGIAGVLAYSVAQRVPEMGVRLALGARKTDVLALVIVRGMRMALLGVAIGLACSLAVTRLMSGVLYQSSPYDAGTLVAAALFLCAVGLISILIPARRAAGIDPIQALRAE